MPSTQTRKNPDQNNKNIAGNNINNNSSKTNSEPKTTMPIIPTPKTQTTETTENQELSTQLLRPVAKPTTQQSPQRNVSLEPMHQIYHLLGKKQIAQSQNQQEDTPKHTEQHKWNANTDFFPFRCLKSCNGL